MNQEAYHAISALYDRVNAEVDYERWADYMEEHVRRHLPARPELWLDLACGTGSMTLALARRGYDMIGVDGSVDMLCIARDRAYAAEQGGILYLCQDMRSFELYGTVGAVSCCLDSVNYLTDPRDLRACFATVHNYLDPGGLFFFDVNSPYKFANVYGDRAYLFDEETADGRGIFCAWQNDFDPATGLCGFDLTVFTEGSDGRWHREEEGHTERCYSEEELTAALRETGFELLGQYADTDLSPVTETAERWHFVARAKK